MADPVVVLTNGVPTSGSGAITTLGAVVTKLGDGSQKSQVVDGGGNIISVKAASTAPLATDTALVVAISPNSVNPNGPQAPAGSAPVVNADQYSTHKEVGAGATATVLGAVGAVGDYLSHVVVFPGIAGCGVVTILDGASVVGTFAGGGTTALPSLVPFIIPIGAFAQGAGWKITTGANVTVSAVGKFT